MGMTHVDVTIRNPAAPERSWTGSFLVDTGAIHSLVPRPHLEAIGLEPIGQRVYETVDGRRVALDITRAWVDVMGQPTAGTVIFGDSDAEPLLGVTAAAEGVRATCAASRRLARITRKRRCSCCIGATRPWSGTACGACRWTAFSRG